MFAQGSSPIERSLHPVLVRLISKEMIYVGYPLRLSCNRLSLPVALLAAPTLVDYIYLPF